MRKKPTYEELARATLENKSTVLGSALPYTPPNDATDAIMQLREMTQQVQAKERIGQDVARDIVEAARDLGVAPTVIQQAAAGTVQPGSDVAQALMQQQQGIAAQQTRQQQLQTDAILRSHASTQRTMDNMAQLQQQTSQSLADHPERIGAAVAAQMRNMPLTLPPEMMAQLQGIADQQLTAQQLQDAWARFGADQNQHGNRMMQAMMDRQSTAQGALVRSQSDMSSSLDAFMQRTAGAIVPQGQSQEAAQQMVLRLIEQMTAMFQEAYRGTLQ